MPTNQREFAMRGHPFIRHLALVISAFVFGGTLAGPSQAATGHPGQHLGRIYIVMGKVKASRRRREPKETKKGRGRHAEAGHIYFRVRFLVTRVEKTPRRDNAAGGYATPQTCRVLVLAFPPKAGSRARGPRVGDVLRVKLYRENRKIGGFGVLRVLYYGPRDRSAPMSTYRRLDLPHPDRLRCDRCGRPVAGVGGKEFAAVEGMTARQVQDYFPDVAGDVELHEAVCG
jgi:hypothetical protein